MFGCVAVAEAYRQYICLCHKVSTGSCVIDWLDVVHASTNGDVGMIMVYVTDYRKAYEFINGDECLSGMTFAGYHVMINNEKWKKITGV